MTGGPSPNLEAAFKTALLNQGELALLIFAMLAIAWVACRELLPIRTRVRLSAEHAALPREPLGRSLLRIGFGVLWVFDGILQAQPAMPGGLPADVISPAAGSSPEWVRHMVSWAGSGWVNHPVQDAAGAVWVQLGIGVWLIASARGNWSRLAGLTSVVWGLVVWIFGEAFGGLLGHGASVLTGAPGAALIYCAAGALIALPERNWQDFALGRRSLQVIGGCLAALAVQQAWPGRGSWQGRLHGQPGPLAAMISSMAKTKQPTALAHTLAAFGTFTAQHGFAVNLVPVVVLAICGGCLLTGMSVIARPAVAVLIAFCLADWVLVQDLGFFGGTGTDPNSMIPLALLVVAAFLGMVRPASRPEAITGSGEAPIAATGETRIATGEIGIATDPVPVRNLASTIRIKLGTANASVVVALWAAGVMALGAASMAFAAASHLG